MSRPASFIQRVGEDVTWLVRSLGDRDATTAWPAVIWTNPVFVGGDFDPFDFDCDDFLCWVIGDLCEETGDFDPDDFDCDDFNCGLVVCEDLKMIIRRITQREVDTPAGRVTEERLRGYISFAARHLDRIIYNGETYEVEHEAMEWMLLGNEKYRDVTMLKVT